MIRTISVLLLSLAMALVAAGQVKPAGEAFQISLDARFDIPMSDVVTTTDGGFAVAWTDWRWPMWCRAYGRAGQPRSDGFEVNLGVELAPSIAPNGPGGFVTVGHVWDEPGGSRILAQRYDADGRARGDPIVISTGWEIGAPFVASNASGRFVVIWMDREPMHVVWAQRFEVHGRRLGSQVQVGGLNGNYVTPLSVSMDRAGGFVVAWEESGWGWSTGLARRYDAAGNAGPLIRLGTHPERTYQRPSVCVTARGDFIVASTYGIDHAHFLVLSRYDANSTLQGEVEIPMPTFQQNVATVACEPDGHHITAWTGPSPGTGELQVVARRYSPEGVATDEWLVTENGRWPDVGAFENGGFVVTWTMCGNAEFSCSVMGRRYLTPPKGDFDGDLGTDLLLRHESGRARVWTMAEGVRQSNLAVWPEPDVTQEIVGVDDFDGDLRNDLLLRNLTDGALTVWRLGGYGGVERQGVPLPVTGPVTPPLTWRIAATGDFNHDGQPDLVWHNSITRRIAIWVMEGVQWAGTLRPSPDQGEVDWEIVAALDFNEDGERDLLWYNPTSGRVVQWLLDGELRRTMGRFTSPPHAGNANWRVVAAGDYGVGPGGMPGTNDIVWRHAISGRAMVWFLDEAGQRTAATYTLPEAPADPRAWTVVGPK